jgi:hypothetical protein
MYVMCGCKARGPRRDLQGYFIPKETILKFSIILTAFTHAMSRTTVLVVLKAIFVNKLRSFVVFFRLSIYLRFNIEIIPPTRTMRLCILEKFLAIGRCHLKLGIEFKWHTFGLLYTDVVRYCKTVTTIRDTVLWDCDNRT